MRRALAPFGTRLNARRPARSIGLDSRGTPRELMAALQAEFAFTLDPCPLDISATAGAGLWGKDGLARSWRGERIYCNPPYSDVGPWLAKAREAAVAVYLLPVKTDLAWWHDHVMRADEIRLFRGRLRFEAMSGGPPFPSALVIFDERRGDSPPEWKSVDRPPRIEP